MNTPFLNNEDMADLGRLDDLFSDDQGWDLPTERMRRLAELGVIRHRSGGHYCITAFGSHCLDPEWGLPLRTTEQINADQAAGITRMPGTSTAEVAHPPQAQSTPPAQPAPEPQAQASGAVVGEATINNLQRLLNELRVPYGSALWYENKAQELRAAIDALAGQAVAHQPAPQAQAEGAGRDHKTRVPLVRVYFKRPGFCGEDCVLIRADDKAENHIRSELITRTEPTGESIIVQPSPSTPTAGKVAEGFVLAPAEATDEMRDAGMAAYMQKGLMDDIYRAMLAAAPPSPQGHAPEGGKP